MIQFAVILVEIMMFIAGLRTLISGSLPQGLFADLFGKGVYQVGTFEARLYGLVLCTPGSLFVATIVIAMLFGEQAVEWTFLPQVVLSLAVTLVALIWAKGIKRANEQLKNDV